MLNQLMGKVETIVGTSQIGGKKLNIDAPDQPGDSLGLARAVV
jgi:hypothetical protein